MPNNITAPSQSWQSDQIIKERCPGSNPCFWCRLTGNHSQSPLERQTLIKQSVLGILVLIILLSILVGAAVLTWRMIA